MKVDFTYSKTGKVLVMQERYANILQKMKIGTYATAVAIPESVAGDSLTVPNGMHGAVPVRVKRKYVRRDLTAKP